MLNVTSSNSMSMAAGLAAFGLMATTPAFADWTGKGEAGLVLANGNTDTKNANAKLELAKKTDQWKHSFGIAAIYASTDELTTGQRWEVFGQSDYNFGAKNFWFGAGRYEDDRFSGFDYQATASTGVGRHFIDSARTKFTGTAGVGYKFFRTSDTFDDITGVLLQRGAADNEGVFRGTLDYTNELTATTKIGNEFLVESGANNTFLQNEVALQVKMTDVLALAFGYSVRYNSNPPPGFGRTDTLTTLNLVYEIK
jgi:putative salt-induced outer membrane protein